jgi:hypothetical protein
MIAKLFATGGSTETDLAHFSFEATFKEAATLGTFSGGEDFFIVKADKYVGTIEGHIEELEESKKKTIACIGEAVFKVCENLKKGDKVKLIVCTASE